MKELRLILNDGTIIEGGTAGFAQGFLWLWVTGFTMAQAAQTFIDPEKTARIVFEYGQMSYTYEGFTDCTVLQIDVDGRVSVCLKKGES